TRQALTSRLFPYTTLFRSLQDAADALGLAVGRVQDAVARLDLARVDAEVGELPDVRIGHDLEGERRERRLERGRSGFLLCALRRSEEHTSELQSRGQLVCR